MSATGKLSCIVVVFVVSVSSLGCGRGDLPELGTVQGTVTMDGKPLSGVLVQFHSDAGGRPGTGVTDEEGNYELTYTAGVKGTKLGPSTVEITTVWPDGEPGPGQRETIPARYNTDSTLKADVQPGSNPFDFELESAAGTKR